MTPHPPDDSEADDLLDRDEDISEDSDTRYLTEQLKKLDKAHDIRQNEQ